MSCATSDSTAATPRPTTLQLCDAVSEVAGRLADADRACLLQLVDRVRQLHIETPHPRPQSRAEETGLTYSVEVEVRADPVAYVFDKGKPFDRAFKFARRVYNQRGPAAVRRVVLCREDGIKRPRHAPPYKGVI